ncbi:MAG: hypothetical protein M3O50_02405 [Myxococcota bacterium]|nr:hypothetical protein [Myxococcota bacterium]
MMLPNCAHVLFAGLLFAGLGACASHSDRTLPVRTALDAGEPQRAIELLNEHMKVHETDLPRDLDSENALYVLDRGSIEQSIAQFGRSKRDFEASDKAIDMLDLAHDVGDTIGEYVFSGSSGKYEAPPYEKLLINTLDMINYLELRDLNGARVEARRLAVMQRYVADSLHERQNPVLGLGALLAGLTFEQSGEIDEALRWYDEALEFPAFRALRGPVRALLTRGHYRSPRLTAIETTTEVLPRSLDETREAELVVLVGYGRVPHKIAQRMPIGLALTWASGALSPEDVESANQLAAQGLVTWVNYPTLGADQGGYALPTCTLDGTVVVLDEAVDVTRAVRAEWKSIEAKIIVSAITRTLARFGAGKLAQAAAGRQELLGTLLSLGAQVTLTALDTPDTRSWETLPARFAFARVHVPAGKHTVRIDARGVSRNVEVDLPIGGWGVTSLMALR